MRLKRYHGLVEPLPPLPILLRDAIQQQLDELKRRNQFVGLQRLSLEYLAAELPDASHATVTTRERFLELLRSGSSPLSAVIVVLREEQHAAATYRVIGP